MYIFKMCVCTDHQFEINFCLPLFYHQMDQINKTNILVVLIFLVVLLVNYLNQSLHCVKNVPIRSYFWSVFPVFGLNTKINSVNLRIHSEYRKILTKNNSVFGHFSCSVSQSENNEFGFRFQQEILLARLSFFHNLLEKFIEKTYQTKFYTV